MIRLIKSKIDNKNHSTNIIFQSHILLSLNNNGLVLNLSHHRIIQT